MAVADLVRERELEEHNTALFLFSFSPSESLQRNREWI